MNNLFKLFRMRRLWRPKWAALFMFGMFLLLPNISIAAVNLPWSTTYNCADWTQGQTLNCDGISPHGDWTTSAGSREQITSSANYPGGGSGRGQRQWNGDGINNVSGNTRISWTTVEPELWVRWYMRYEAGYTWQTVGDSLSYDKWLYFDQGTNHYGLVEGWTYWDQTRFLSNYGTYGISASGNGWDTIMANGGTVNGHKTSDGQWHCYEVHIKMDSGNATNGEGDIWIDDTLRISTRNVVNYSGTSGATGWTSTLMGSNQRAPNNGRDVYVDFDDIAISATGRIGCLGSDTTAPTQPANLSAAAILSSQINLSWTASTDNIGVTGYRIYRCSGSGCVPSTQIATSATNSYSNTGLTANTTYVYRVAAYDAAGNISGQSTSASAATQAVVDTTPPAAPTGLIVM